MKLYSHKDLKFGFVVLCPDHSIGLLKSTTNSIKNRYPGTPFICIVDNTIKENELKEMNVICPTFKGRDTFSSLINIGMSRAAPEWNFIICAGVNIRSGLDKKFAFFVEDENDILFPISDGKYHFVEGTINGIFMNKNFFKKVGAFLEKGDLELVKTEWALKAIANKCKFKAIANCKIC